MVPAIVSFLVCTVVAFGITSLALVWPQKEPWTLHEPNVQPIRIDFDRPLKDYKDGEQLGFELRAKGTQYIYMFLTRDSGTVLIYPPPGTKLPAKTDKIRSKDFPGGESKIAIDGSGELHIIALDKDLPPIDASDFNGIDPTNGNVNISRETLENEIKLVEKGMSEDYLHQKIVLPQLE